ncbi:ubiquitin-like protein ATG12 [Octodon degus]|uniref:Ubiquitin-like protein ATG12 n=1 Tax=Octodon degus TaxID=10160 RepID=A0A6P3VA40_OCTDE|nr:ubiquitin-like protein ATG12 [Octodon degus]
MAEVLEPPAEDDADSVAGVAGMACSDLGGWSVGVGGGFCAGRWRESQTLLQLPSWAVAAGGEGPGELSPKAATPGPPFSAAVLPGTEEPTSDTKKKNDILLRAVGDTRIMKTKKWAVEQTRIIQRLIDFIKKFLKLVASEQLFIYVNQSFIPSQDQEVGTLYKCFGSDGKLVLCYCKSQAWG